VRDLGLDVGDWNSLGLERVASAPSLVKYFDGSGDSSIPPISRLSR
jgi:hypothetical protein